MCCSVLTGFTCALSQDQPPAFLTIGGDAQSSCRGAAHLTTRHTYDNPEIWISKKRTVARPSARERGERHQVVNNDAAYR
jgi:hypothetical protein